MTTTETATLTYTVTHDAWYSQHIPNQQPEISVAKASSGGGVFWEFMVKQVSSIGVRVEIFDDAWPAFTEIPDFFTRLAELGQGADMQDVIDVLDGLGFTDRTDRTGDAHAVASEVAAARAREARQRVEHLIGRVDDETWRALQLNLAPTSTTGGTA